MPTATLPTIVMEEATFHNTYPLHAEASIEVAVHYYATHITDGRFGNYNSTQTHQQMALLERLASSHATIIRELNRQYGINKQAYTYADNVMAITQHLGKFWRDGSSVPYVSSSSISNLRKIAKIAKDNLGGIDFAHFVETRWDQFGESSDLLTGFCFRFFHDLASGLDNYAESRTRKALKKLRAFIAASPSIHLPSPPPTDIAPSASPSSTTLAETRHQPPPSTVRTAIPTCIESSRPTNLLDYQKTMTPPPSALDASLSTTGRPFNTFDSRPCTPSHNTSFSTEISRGFSAGSISTVRSWGRDTSFATTVADTGCSDLPNSPPDQICGNQLAFSDAFVGDDNDSDIFPPDGNLSPVRSMQHQTLLRDQEPVQRVPLPNSPRGCVTLRLNQVATTEDAIPGTLAASQDPMPYLNSTDIRPTIERVQNMQRIQPEAGLVDCTGVRSDKQVQTAQDTQAEASLFDDTCIEPDTQMQCNDTNELAGKEDQLSAQGQPCLEQTRLRQRPSHPTHRGRCAPRPPLVRPRSRANYTENRLKTVLQQCINSPYGRARGSLGSAQTSQMQADLALLVHRYLNPGSDQIVGGGSPEDDDDYDDTTKDGTYRPSRNAISGPSSQTRRKNPPRHSGVESSTTSTAPSAAPRSSRKRPRDN